MPQVIDLASTQERKGCHPYFHRAEVYKPDPEAEQEDWDLQMIEFELDHSADRDKAQAIVTERLGQGWLLWNHWIPEDWDEF